MPTASPSRMSVTQPGNEAANRLASSRARGSGWASSSPQARRSRGSASAPPRTSQTAARYPGTSSSAHRVHPASGTWTSIGAPSWTIPTSRLPAEGGGPSICQRTASDGDWVETPGRQRSRRTRTAPGATTSSSTNRPPWVAASPQLVESTTRCASAGAASSSRTPRPRPRIEVRRWAVWICGITITIMEIRRAEKSQTRFGELGRRCGMMVATTRRTRCSNPFAEPCAR